MIYRTNTTFLFLISCLVCLRLCVRNSFVELKALPFPKKSIALVSPLFVIRFHLYWLLLHNSIYLLFWNENLDAWLMDLLSLYSSFISHYIWELNCGGILFKAIRWLWFIVLMFFFSWVRNFWESKKEKLKPFFELFLVLFLCIFPLWLTAL